MSVWFLYLIHTQNNRLYTGITTDVERRFSQHQRGKGAKALRGAGELTLVFSYPVGDKSLALRAEYRVKQFTRAEKEHLLTDNTKLVNLLASLHTSAD
ncbi:MULTISPECIES: GIY-YIG nuclease family protein [Mangrovibacter]|uniref:Putative endonuclease n=1 Tax=Mangrovibacter plantisponsor TaxID=451513 RepID=A0A317Q0D8_9ENTR|nr:MULTISPECIES: GIY-YIG nuclease family protein [Mangrovibacter]KEA53741.1 GIY-YIG nuclease superfamily protein [Mangrovibacter sp. MFB070]PWW06005.1 putative endonuclease [Mangrovibacter plantisponsor]